MSTQVENEQHHPIGKLYAGMTIESIRADIDMMTFKSEEEREKALNKQIQLFNYANSLVPEEVDDEISEKEIEAYHKEEQAKKEKRKETWKNIGLCAASIGIGIASFLMIKKIKNKSLCVNKNSKLSTSHDITFLNTPTLTTLDSLSLKNTPENIPKLDALNIDENALCLVHMSDFAPSGGKIMSVREAMGASRNSVHFSLNHPVKTHYFGSWEKCKYAYIMPYKSTREINTANKFIEGLPADLYTNGSVKIPEGSVIIKFNKGIEPGKVLVSSNKNIQGVKIIETSDNVHETANKVIEKMGYTKMKTNQAGTFLRNSSNSTQESNIESIAEECQAWMNFCKTQDIKPMMHTYSPNGLAESIIESLDMLATTNRWKNGAFNKDFKKLMLKGIEDIKKQVNENGYYISMDLDKLANIISTSYNPRIALHRVKRQLNIKPIAPRKKKIFSKENDYRDNLDYKPISIDNSTKKLYDFYSKDIADPNQVENVFFG